MEKLGFTVSSEGIKPPSRRIKAMDDFLRPETVDKVRRFLGMLNFYRSCIPRASGISAALNKVLKGLLANDKKIPLNLDARRKSCTTKQQKTLTEQTTFLSPNTTLPLRTDTLNTVIGTSLEQVFPPPLWVSSPVKGRIPRKVTAPTIGKLLLHSFY